MKKQSKLKLVNSDSSSSDNDIFNQENLQSNAEENSNEGHEQAITFEK